MWLDLLYTINLIKSLSKLINIYKYRSVPDFISVFIQSWATSWPNAMCWPDLLQSFWLAASLDISDNLLLIYLGLGSRLHIPPLGKSNPKIIKHSRISLLKYFMIMHFFTKTFCVDCDYGGWERKAEDVKTWFKKKYKKIYRNYNANIKKGDRQTEINV